MSEFGFGRPAVVITLGLEQRPYIVWDCVDSAEQARLEDWVGSHDDYLRLVAMAYDLAEQQRAA